MKRTLLLTLQIFLVLALLLLPTAVHAGSPAQSRFDQVDAYLEAQIEKAHIPGLAIGIVEGDQIVHLRGYGTAGPDRRAVTPQTPFILGSVSKGITALAVMQLVESNKLELDAPVSQYLSWFSAQDITIRHLLNQSSGITTSTGRSMFADEYDGSDAIQIAARKMSAAPRPYPAGERYQYSNANYVILGAVIEAVSGQTYDAYMREHVFGPLEMANTYATQHVTGAHPMAVGHSQVLGFPIPFDAPYPAGSVPAGYLFTSAEDMAHYLVAQLNGGVYQGKQIVSEAGIDTLHRGGVAVNPGHSYAMGWEVGEYEGLQAMTHRGDVCNFQSNTILLPDQKLGLIMLVNEYSAFNNSQISHLAWDVAHLLVGQEPLAVPAEPMMYVVVGIVAATVVIILLLLGWASRIVRSGSGRKQAIRMAAAALLLLGMAAFNLVGFAILFETPIPGMLLFAPELAWPVVIAGVAAAAGALIFPALLIFGARSSARREMAAALPQRS